MQEIFKDIQGYEGLYQVSNFGRVKSFKRNNSKTLKNCIDTNGYYFVNIYKNRIPKKIQIAHLVWDHFGNGKRNGRVLQVDHIDNNKLNNRIDNLQLLSARDNVSKGYIQNGNITSEYTGVYKQNKKWIACVCINGKQKYLGSFNNEYDAYLAYQKRLKEIEE